MNGLIHLCPPLDQPMFVANVLSALHERWFWVLPNKTTVKHVVTPSINPTPCTALNSSVITLSSVLQCLQIVSIVLYPTNAHHIKWIWLPVSILRDRARLWSNNCNISELAMVRFYLAIHCSLLVGICLQRVRASNRNRTHIWSTT